jgi:hypothetical protein
MGNLKHHKTHTPYKGEYDLSIFENEALAKKLSEIKTLKILSLKQAPETGTGGGWDLETAINILINNPITPFLLTWVATKVLDYLLEKAKEEHKKSFSKIGETAVIQFNKEVYIFNPSLSKKDFKCAIKNLFHKRNEIPNNKKRHFLFWDRKRKHWCLLWEE